MADVQATNLTELWWDEEKETVLALNGFRARGSDFERFRSFCVCMERMGECRIKRDAEAWLSMRFGGRWVLNSATCNRVWTLTADRLTLPEDLWSPIPTVWEESPRNGDASRPAFSVRSTEALPSFANGWKAWEEDFSNWFAETVKRNQIPLLRLSNNCAWKKPDLYHVERHLSGMERDDRIWESQAAVQLLGQCRRNGIRLAVACADGAALLALLKGAERFTPLPRMVWLTEGQSLREELGAISKQILKHWQGEDDGIPPVFIAKCGNNGRRELPAGLICEIKE